jgi:hypothetical protein
MLSLTSHSRRSHEAPHLRLAWRFLHEGYYGAYVFDPDGNNVEAVHHTVPSG